MHHCARYAPRLTTAGRGSSFTFGYAGIAPLQRARRRHLKVSSALSASCNLAKALSLSLALALFLSHFQTRMIDYSLWALLLFSCYCCHRCCRRHCCYSEKGREPQLATGFPLVIVMLVVPIVSVVVVLVCVLFQLSHSNDVSGQNHTRPLISSSLFCVVSL